MKISRKNQANLIRDVIAATLPGGSYVYVVSSNEETLDRIVRANLNTRDEQQTLYYIDKIVNDTRNHISSSKQNLVVGQVIYIPKRIA